MAHMIAEPIYDETLVPAYTLPDPLAPFPDGSAITVEEWRNVRRREIRNLFAEHVYGRTPRKGPAIAFRIIESSRDALGGKAVRKQVQAVLRGNGQTRTLNLLVYIPAQRDGPAPSFIGLNFQGNQTIHPDPDIRAGDAQTDAAPRGSRTDRWPLEAIVDQGFALVTLHCNDLFPDHPQGRAAGIAPLFPQDDVQAPDAWGAIGMWAWGLSRVLDYCAADPDLDATRVAVVGHSRLGKAALWAGAQDQRFALVISNNSGCGGAAISRRRFGETVAAINQGFPHWFCPRFHTYSDREDALPVDQHMLLALTAPRPLYVASAQDDLWADPRGEYLSAFHATPVYGLLGHTGLTSEAMPPVNQPVGSRIGYHIRSGPHEITAYDWAQYLRFAAKHR
ncbi:MAG: acetylxylan esterase [Caldilineaceae bacterium]|nr:acetylxylan esterase [Caldilineaceae bacterium]